MSKTAAQRITILKKRLNRIEKKLFEISKITATTKETTNIFWSRMRSQARKAYGEARLIYADWTKINIPWAYNDSVRQQIKRIKDLAFKPKKTVNYLAFKNSDISKRTTGIIVRDSISDYTIGLNSGSKKLNRLMGLTQQLNITEARLNQVIAEGFEETGSIFTVRKRLQNELVKDALDKKYIMIIDKNGKPRNYGVKTYAELVSRTKMIDAQTEGTVNLALAYENDLIQVSAHNTETPYDAQFEGRIYSLSGKDKDFPPAGDLPSFHPNCIHVTSVYFKEAHTDKQVKEMSDFSQGKTQQHPFRKGLLPSDDIAGRIAKAEGAKTVTREMRNEAARLKREFKKTQRI